MKIAKWAGTLAAVLAVGCAGQRAESGSGDASRTTGVATRTEDSTRDATSPRTEGSGTVAGSGGSATAGVLPGGPSDGRTAEGGRAPVSDAGPGVGGGSDRSSAAMTSGARREVYGQVNSVSKSEIEIEPEYGEPVRLKVTERTMMEGSSADPTRLEEGDEVRASFDASHNAVELKTGDDARPIESTSPSSSGSMSPSRDSTHHGSSSDTSSSQSGSSSGTR